MCFSARCLIRIFAGLARGPLVVDAWQFPSVLILAVLLFEEFHEALRVLGTHPAARRETLHSFDEHLESFPIREHGFALERLFLAALLRLLLFCF